MPSNEDFRCGGDLIKQVFLRDYLAAKNNQIGKPSSTWSLVDLRPLRHEIAQNKLSVRWEYWQLITSFDAICYLGQTHHASLPKAD